MIKLILYIVFEKYVNILTLKMASPRNQHCVNRQTFVPYECWCECFSSHAGLAVAPLNTACSAVMMRVEHRTLSAHACSAVRPASQPAAGHDLLLVEVAAAAGPHCFRVEIYSASQMRHLDWSGRLHLPQPLPR